MTMARDMQQYLDALRHGYDILTGASDDASRLGTTIPQRLVNEIAIGRFQALELARSVAADADAVLSGPYAPLMEEAIAGQSRALAWVKLAYLDTLRPPAGESSVSDELAAASQAAAEAADAIASSWGDLWRLIEAAAEQPREALALPMDITLGGASLHLRRLEQGDGPLILAFAHALPPHDLLFLRRDITQPAQVEGWLRDAAEGLSDTVLALHNGELVGYAAVVSEGLNWTRHLGELRIVVSPSMRGKGAGRLLTEQAFAMAKQRGVKKMMAQMTTDQQSATAVFERMGFEREAVLKHHVMDRDGALHDLQIMSLDVDAFQAKLLAAVAEPQQGA